MDQEKANKYVRGLIEQYHSDPSKLGVMERNAISAHLDYSEKAQQLLRDRQTLVAQIQQAQARVRTIDLDLRELSGKASAPLELIVAVKFGKDEPVQPAAPVAKGNRKQRRTKKKVAKKGTTK